MKTPALLCLCFQALAEALKTNASVTDINLGVNQIRDDGAEVVRGMGSADAAACHDVTFPYFPGIL